MSGDDAIEDATSGPLRVCARYLLPMDAQVFAACLQSEGIAAVVMDADTIYVTGAVFSALPRGGVRVMVPAPQLDAAMRMRERYDAGEFAIDENFDVGPVDPETY
jgi:hypothetical protein